jgi:hypothetical protein
MHGARTLGIAICFFIAAVGGFAQQSPPTTASTDKPNGPSRGATTVRGCLDRSRGNYLLIEDQTSLVYVLKGVGSKLDHQLHHQVEVKGTVLPGTIKTGIRSQKSGSNPSDTVHGADGLPLQIANVETDVRTIAKHCKAVDQQ